MHNISQSLLLPVVVLLICFVLYALWCIGSILMEYTTERRNYKIQMPPFLAALSAAKPDEVAGIIARSGLLKRQKSALLIHWDYRCLRRETHVALSKRLIANEDERYRSITGRTDSAAKVAPMFGLMGTLIPLGPGIVALGRSDLTTLSSSLGIAFDTTVCGLITAAVCLVVSRIRKKWYESYMVSLESAMTTVLEIVDDMRENGTLDTVGPGTSVVDFGYAPHGYQTKMIDAAIEQSDARAAESDAARAISDAARAGAGAADKRGGTSVREESEAV